MLCDSLLCDDNGAPLPLTRTGPAPGFEALAQSVTRHVHPRSLLSALDLAQGSARIGGQNLVASPEQLAQWAAALAVGQLVRARVAASEPGQPATLLALHAGSRCAAAR